MFATVLGWLGNLLGGPFAKAAVDAYRAKLSAENTSEKIAADLKAREIAADTREAELDKALLVKEQGHFITRIIRPLFGLAGAILTWKLLVWDLALGQWTKGHTDKLSDQSSWLLTTMVVAYMGGRSLERFAQLFGKR